MQDVMTQDVVGRGLTEPQAKLVDAISSGSSKDEAQHIAGYVTEGNLAQAMRSEAVQAELKARRSAQISGVLAQKALKTLENLIDDERTPAATRFSAAKWLLEQSGHTADQGGMTDKPLAEMTEAELSAFIQRAQQAVDAGGEPPLIKVSAPKRGAKDV